jgi:hypothetical protein
MTIMAIRNVVKMVQAVVSAAKAASETKFLAMDRLISVVVRVSGGLVPWYGGEWASVVGRADIAAEMMAKGRKFLLCLRISLMAPVAMAIINGWCGFVVWLCVFVSSVVF